MHSDNIVSLRTLHSPPFYPALSREVSWLPLGVRKNLDMAERSVEEILGDIPRFKESCEQVWAWLQSQKPTLDGGPATDTDEQISVGTKDDENDRGISRRRLGLAVSHDGPDIASADCLPWRTINYLHRRLGLTVSHDGPGIASADCLPWRAMNYL